MLYAKAKKELCGLGKGSLIYTIQMSKRVDSHALFVNHYTCIYIFNVHLDKKSECVSYHRRIDFIVCLVSI